MYVPAYDERGALESETLHVQATKTTDADGRPTFEPHPDAAKNVQAIRLIT